MSQAGSRPLHGSRTYPSAGDDRISSALMRWRCSLPATTRAGRVHRCLLQQPQAVIPSMALEGVPSYQLPSDEVRPGRSRCGGRAARACEALVGFVADVRVTSALAFFPGLTKECRIPSQLVQQVRQGRARAFLECTRNPPFFSVVLPADGCWSSFAFPERSLEMDCFRGGGRYGICHSWRRG